MSRNERRGEDERGDKRSFICFRGKKTKKRKNIAEDQRLVEKRRYDRSQQKIR